MNNSNYQDLTEAELRNYIKMHPNNEEGFQPYLTISLILCPS